MDIFDLSGKIAIVTGGNRGIGFGITKGLANAGATVVIANRNAPAGQAAAESAKKEGLNVIAIATDVSDISSIASMVAKVINNFGKIDILVNNAAVVRRNPPEDISEEDWDFTMNINLKGLFFCCQLVGREMIKHKKGKIINVSSIGSYLVRHGASVYAASKAGVSHLTRALAFEWARYNINVNAIAPGLTLTDMSKKRFEEYPGYYEKVLSEIPRGRVGVPDDYAGAAIFFASEASDYITGQVLYIDGGVILG